MPRSASTPNAPARASIVIVAWGKRPVTQRCLAILADALGDELGRRFELVLVDNDSPDDTAELFEAWRDRATVVILPSNRNFAGGCNAGANASSGDVLIFLNNDVDVVEGALEALADQVSEPGVGAAGARLLYPDGTLQHAGVAMLGGGDIVVPHHIFHHMDGGLPPARGTFELDVVTGACLAIRRDVFAEVGGFDELYANGWEDVDLCLRVRTAGWPIVYRGDIAMVHDEGQTRGEIRGADANAHHFYARWRGLLDPDDEFAARTFDARLPVRAQAVPRQGGPVFVSGRLSAIGPAADEARALLMALEQSGLDPAAHEPVPAFIEPRLEDGEWDLIHAARARRPALGAVELSVPEGDSGAPAAGNVARLATLPGHGLAGTRAVWAASPTLVTELVAHGFDRDRIELVAPPVSPAPVGSGGGGLLAVLPAHDTRASAALLDALAELGDVPIQIVPTVVTCGLAELVAARVAAAELLAPCSSERRFALLAGDADAVIACDSDDPYDRRALVAAAAGTPALASSGGPAEWILSDGVPRVDPYNAASIRAAVSRALEAQLIGRKARASMIRDICAPAAMSERLRTLVDRLAREGTRAA